jgi:FlaA1/EpsC-like NDP-sugar epimerase
MTELPRGARRISPLRGLLIGVFRYGPAFVLEVGLFWSALLGFNLLAMDHATAGRAVPAGLLLVIFGLGFAEWRFKLYRRVWAVAGLQDAVAIILAVVEASLLIAAGNILVPSEFRPFRIAIPILAAPAAAALVGFFRLLPRLRSRAPRADNRLLIVVRDSTSYATVKTLVQTHNRTWSTVAIVSSAEADLNRTVAGIPVVGTTDDLGHWIDVTRADGVAFVLEDSSSATFHRLLGVCLDRQLPIFVVPGPEEWLETRSGDRLRRLSADDLVGRTPRQIDVEHAGDVVSGKVVLVTGAAGSIGSEISRIISTLRPSRLILVDNNESGLFDIAEELHVIGTVDIREALVSIEDQGALADLFNEERPDIVFHAAAYKHVPMLETHPGQALGVNVVGTVNTLRSAEAAGAQQFVLISTDKAATRHSVMGCTKRLCELLVLTHQGTMNCWAVRFGNVVGSRGSVVPTFERQIRMGGPVTITHPDVTRYMMTIREAASLVVTTLRLANPRHLYMLDMGVPIRIVDLANALIRSRGMRPGADIDIVFTGLRPGERLTEDLLAPDEGWRSTAHDAILEVVSPVLAGAEELTWVVDRLENLVRGGNVDQFLRLLRKSVRVAASEPIPTSHPAPPSPALANWAERVANEMVDES